ncbi:MAG: hypothetical protein NT178_18085 [Proteobacteria bacterium]|nr:hypothetical protein [Pseudomonadota bacterium]
MNEVRKEVEKILSENQQDWEERFYEYYEKIINNSENIEKNRQKFHMRGFLRAYMNFGQAMKKTPKFSIRYGGQIAGIMKFMKNKKEPILVITPKQAKDNNKWFKFDLPNGEYAWRSSAEAQKFRERFEKNPPPPVRQDEHRLETFILDEMFNPTIKKFCGTFKNIQPVCIANNVPFQMLIPIRARGGKIGYKDGHIDIVARYGRGTTSLLAIEIKRPGGQYQGAAKQAYIYAVTMSYMFNKTGDNFKKHLYTLCGYKNVYSNLKIHAVVAIPDTYKSKFSQEQELLNASNINVDIPIHYITYQLADNQRIKVIGTSLET